MVTSCSDGDPETPTSVSPGPTTTGDGQTSAATTSSDTGSSGTTGVETTTGSEPTSTAPNETSTAPNETTTTGPDETTTPGDVVKGVTSVGARCDRAERIGSLSVALGADRTIVSGALSSGTLPTSVARVQAEAGGCELLVPRDLFCSTACPSDQACAGNDTCVPKPTKLSGGPVTVEGLLVDLEFAPNGITLDYSKTVLEPFPAYEAGAEITLRTAGATAPAFEATVYGVPQLTSSLPVVSVKHGEPSHLEWSTEGVPPEQSSIFISFSVNVHGAVTGWIECTAPDTGSFDIPAELVSSLIDLGLSGFPRVSLERRSSATVALDDGCVDVYSSSKLTLEIEVDGLSSCNRDEDCPEGQRCSEELACE